MRDVLFWTFVIVSVWYWRREKAAILRFLRARGWLPAALDAEPSTLPGSTPFAALEADISLPSLRVLATPQGDLRIECDLVLRNRPGQTAVIRLGLCDASGAALPIPGGSNFVRFSDGVDTLGEELHTPPAARMLAWWHAQHTVIRRADLRRADGPAAFQVRAEVWMDGSKETSARESVRIELGKAGPATPRGPRCVSCRGEGANTPCPRCGANHHEACMELNQGCTVLACAHRG